MFASLLRVSFFCLVLSSASLWAASCADLFLNLLKENRFTTDRGLFWLAEGMPRMGEDMAKLRKGDRWIDMGGGQGIASFEYLNRLDLEAQAVKLRQSAVADEVSRAIESDFKKISSIPLEERAESLVITFDKSGRFAEAFEKPGVRRPNFIDKRLFEDIPLEEIGKAKLVTDFFGVFSYTHQLDETLRRYLKILEPSGSIHMYLGSGARNTLIEARGGRQIPLVDWLLSIEGLEVQAFATRNKGANSVRIQPRPGVSVRVPKLELLKVGEGAPPPPRLFREVAE